MLRGKMHGILIWWLNSNHKRHRKLNSLRHQSTGQAVSSIKGIVSDSNNIFWWHESEDIYTERIFLKFQLIPISCFQVMHDYVYNQCFIDYCAKLIAIDDNLCQNCSHFIQNDSSNLKNKNWTPSTIWNNWVCLSISYLFGKQMHTKYKTCDTKCKNYLFSYPTMLISKGSISRWFILTQNISWKHKECN